MVNGLLMYKAIVTFGFWICAVHKVQVYKVWVLASRLGLAGTFYFNTKQKQQWQRN